jgi:hypothetical protein
LVVASASISLGCGSQWQIGRQRRKVAKRTFKERNYVTELFSTAVGQLRDDKLRDDKLEVRLFAIYNLRQIAMDHPDYAQAVVELLAAYVRDSPQRWEGEPPLDVREI